MLSTPSLSHEHNIKSKGHSLTIRLACCMICALLCFTTALAQSTSLPAKRAKTLLIINSYNENSLWAKTIYSPISYYVATEDNVHAEMINLDNTMITDSVRYEHVRQLFISNYSHREVQYVVFIGQVAFSLRDEVQKIWGDIPMLVVSRDLTIGPAEYYFTSLNHTADEFSFQQLAELKDKYNFTAIYVPDFYEQTVDLIHDIIPDMDELVFFSDGVYYNRNLARNIELYLLDNYPDIRFRWVKASANNDMDLQYYLIHRLPKSGLLISSWFYEAQGTFGYPTVVSGDLNLLLSSANPVFSLRHSYIELGSIGGVYVDPTKLREDLIESVRKMIDGAEMRNIKFINECDNQCTIIKYPMLAEYGLSAKRCPEGTIFIDKPLTFWQQYYIEVILLLIAILLVSMMLGRRFILQRNKIETLSRHQRFITNMPVPYSKATIMYNTNGEVINIKYTMYNEAFDKLLRENHLPNRPIWIFQPDFIAEKTAEMLETGEQINFVHYFKNTDSFYSFTLCVVPATSEKHKKKAGKDHSTDELDIFAIDITEQHKSEERLKELSQQLDITLNIAKVIPWSWDITTDMMVFDSFSLFERFVNPDDPDPSKRTKAYLSSAEYMRMIAPEDKEEFRHNREMVLLGRTNKFSIEYRLRTAKDGKEHDEWIEANGIVSRRDENGVPTMVLGSLVVTTERKMAEIAMVEASEKAKEADSMKSTFLANMSHEIRTPLNAIVGFSDLMTETDDIEQRRNYGEIIHRNNDILLNLINDVLDLAKIESNIIDITYSTVDLNKLVDTVANTISMRIKDGVQLIVNHGMPKCFVRADHNRISQISMNLLSNASKFTDTGSITFGYEIRKGREIYFYVTDTGIGVSPDQQGKLFKRFDKLNDFKQGTGLGLSICKSLVEKMGGKIGMESEGEGKGCTFWFTLTYNPVDETDTSIEYVSETSLEDNKIINVNISETRTQDIATNERKLILVAEDIEGNYLLIQQFLQKKYDLIHAWDGQEAIDMFERECPDLVLMDISMPNVDGYQATEAIRKIDPDIPIIAVTAFAYASDRVKILSSGFNDYIAKPVTRTELNEAIERHI